MPAEAVMDRSSEQPERSSIPDPRLTREQVVSRIVHINPTASAEFLGAFADGALQRYLQRLQLTKSNGSRPSRWVRETTTPAIVFREPPE